MKRKVCIISAILLFSVSILCSCGNDKNNTSSENVINIVSDVSSEEISSEETQPEDVSSTENIVIGELTDDFKGDWQVVSVYQEAKISEITGNEGLDGERKQAIHIDADFYEGYNCHFTEPLYKTEEVSSSVLLREYGFNGENVENDFGDNATMLTIEDGNGIDTTTAVYFLKGNNLVKCGLGGHIYLCKRVQAVG